jgi:hypothetical protein
MFRREKLVHTRKEERGRGRGREGEIKVTYGEGKNKVEIITSRKVMAVCIV